MVIIDRGGLVADAPLAELLARQTQVVELSCADPHVLVETLRARGVSVTVDGNLVVIEGLSAHEAGEIAARSHAGPVYRLTERTATFESAYLELVGTITRPSATGAATDGRTDQ